jgi:hypothetical protein
MIGGKGKLMVEKLGKTGRHPKGKLTEHDEGGLRYGVGIAKNNIIIDFNTPVTWLGLDIESAVVLKNALVERIDELRELQKEG